MPSRGHLALLAAGVALLFVSAAVWDNVRMERLPYTATAFINAASISDVLG